MFGYYLSLGLRSLRRHPVLTALMVFGIALGIAASMTSLTVLHLMGSDPIPWKSDKLHYVQLDNWDINQSFDRDDPEALPDQVSYLDSAALMRASKADKQAAMYKVSLPVQPENPEIKPFQSLGRATGADFFAMFDTPFKYGSAWDHRQDDQHGRVVVLSQATNEKLFGGSDSTGKRVKLNNVEYTVTGVLDRWAPRIKFYDVSNGALNDSEEFYMPFTTAIELEMGASGNNQCFDNSEPGWEGYLRSECIWLQFWVQLDSPARLAEYKSFLDAYVGEQKKLGRFQRPLKTKLDNVTQWLVSQKVVSRDVEIQVGLAFAFLLVCLVNTVGLLLAKFMRKSGEISLRRALGGSKGQLFAQHLVEASVVGVSGGLVGLLLTWVGLLGVRTLLEEFKNVAQLDWTMVMTTILLSVAAAVLAGLFPTWRACRVQPAAQLETQ